MKLGVKGISEVIASNKKMTSLQGKVDKLKKKNAKSDQRLIESEAVVQQLQHKLKTLQAVTGISTPRADELSNSYNSNSNNSNNSNNYGDGSLTPGHRQSVMNPMGTSSNKGTPGTPSALGTRMRHTMWEAAIPRRPSGTALIHNPNVSSPRSRGRGSWLPLGRHEGNKRRMQFIQEAEAPSLPSLPSTPDEPSLILPPLPPAPDMFEDDFDAPPPLPPMPMGGLYYDGVGEDGYPIMPWLIGGSGEHMGIEECRQRVGAMSQSEKDELLMRLMQAEDHTFVVRSLKQATTGSDVRVAGDAATTDGAGGGTGLSSSTTGEEGGNGTASATLNSSSDNHQEGERGSGIGGDIPPPSPGGGSGMVPPAPIPGAPMAPPPPGGMAGTSFFFQVTQCDRILFCSCCNHQFK
jgi:hypothetical protein